MKKAYGEAKTIIFDIIFPQSEPAVDFSFKKSKTFLYYYREFWITANHYVAIIQPPNSSTHGQSMPICTVIHFPPLVFIFF